MSGSTQLDWCRNAFSNDSATEDIATFMSKLFEIEKRLKLDVVKSLEAMSFNANDLPVKIDVLDGIFVADYVLDNLEKDNDNGLQVVESFVAENRHIIEKYGVNVDVFMRIARMHMKSMSFKEIMNIFSVYEQKRTRQLLNTTDLCNIVKTVPNIISTETIAVADLLNELASLCVSNPGKAEIKIQINSPNDIRLSVDTASMLHNIREGIMKNSVDSLESLSGRTFNIEISNKLVKNLFQH